MAKMYKADKGYNKKHIVIITSPGYNTTSYSVDPTVYIYVDNNLVEYTAKASDLYRVTIDETKNVYLEFSKNITNNGSSYYFKIVNMEKNSKCLRQHFAYNKQNLNYVALRSHAVYNNENLNFKNTQQFCSSYISSYDVQSYGMGTYAFDIYY